MENNYTNLDQKYAWYVQPCIQCPMTLQQYQIQALQYENYILRKSLEFYFHYPQNASENLKYEAIPPPVVKTVLSPAAEEFQPKPLDRSVVEDFHDSDDSQLESTDLKSPSKESSFVRGSLISRLRITEPMVRRYLGPKKVNMIRTHMKCDNTPTDKNREKCNDASRMSRGKKKLASKLLMVMNHQLSMENRQIEEWIRRLSKKV